jgi:HEAT repeat protein
MSIPKISTSLSRVLLAVTLAASPLAIGQDAPPDFTKGDAIPEKARHDWNLGATGLRGWMFTRDFSTKHARQIKVTAVADGSPANGTMQVGDVILGVSGKPFAYDPRTEFGKALTIAESGKGAGKLTLTRWRDGKQEDITITLPVLGSYSATAPYDCAKSKLILGKGCATLAKQIADPSYKPDAIVRSINALALLAGGNKEHLPLVKREAQWAAGYEDEGFSTWYLGYVMMLVSEYKLATGDDSVMPGLRRLALAAAKGQSAVGSWGHGFAKPDGRLGGYGMMNAPGLPLTTSLALARAAGVGDPEVPAAIARSLRLLRFYIGKGSIPYGDHGPWMEGHEDNGKCGMAAVLFNLTNEDKGAEFFARLSLSAHGGERDCGHTGNFFNVLWAMPGVSLSGPHATGAWMNEFGAWYYDLARRWDGSFAHLGPPEPDFDSYHDWDATGALLLAYAAPLKNLHILGKRPAKVRQLTAVEAEMHIAPGRGWSQTDRTGVYRKMSDDELIEMLGSWSPILRFRAGAALATRGQPPIDRIIALLDSPSLDAKLGACQAIAELRGKAAAAVPALREALASEDLWLRVQAAEALAAIGKPAAVAVPELLELLAQGPTREDPRAMQQRFVSMALLGSRSELLGPALEGVDRKQLDRALRSGLKNEDGWCRGNIAKLYAKLSFDEIKPLLPAILQAVIEPAPSGEMFADEVRLEGLRVLARHHIREGIAACANYLRDQNPWASEARTPEILKILETYGAHATAAIPRLETLATDYSDGEPDFPMDLSQQKATAVRESIARIKASGERPELRGIK